MTRILVINLAKKFNFVRFARTDAVDLFPAESGVTLIDSTANQEWAHDEIWQDWPKQIERDPKTIADEVLDHSLFDTDYENRVVVALIVDEIADLTPTDTNEADPVAQTAIANVNEVIDRQSERQAQQIPFIGICVSRPDNAIQRDAAVNFIDGDSNIDAIVALGDNRHIREVDLGVRLILDMLTRIDSDIEAKMLFTGAARNAFVLTVPNSEATRANLLRYNFCISVQGKREAGIGETTSAARDSAAFTGLADIIDQVEEGVTALEKSGVDPLETKPFDIVGVAPRFKSADLLSNLDKASREYSRGTLVAVRERVASEVEAARYDGVEGIRTEADVRELIDTIIFPPIQFRQNLVNAIENSLSRMVKDSCNERAGQVSELRERIGSYFSLESDPRIDELVENEKVIDGLDLKQLGTARSLVGFWRAHDALMTAARRLPTRLFCFATYAGVCLAVYAVGFSYMWGTYIKPALRNGSTGPKLSDYDVWQFFALAMQRDPNVPSFDLIFIVVLVITFLLLAAKLAFRRYQKQARRAHAALVDRAAKVASEYSQLLHDIVEYRRRARGLQLRNALLQCIEGQEARTKAKKFAEAEAALQLSTAAQKAVTSSDRPELPDRAAKILKDEAMTHRWIPDYFKSVPKLKRREIIIRDAMFGNERPITTDILFENIEIEWQSLENWNT
ncbi:hypothetical protein AIOL_001859 [Candidatus Rhodobacter oscarellae]|uniref:Uncharacterized protein n=1 Tax=Candidatus Rhodobacter oscarellae TaxID=1675527 RepID=A0A0J9E2I5_9RHOB|nr:hypothetical protein [Candidatus Rhodobacter lobularis]KMW56902.1 hypothetical protein AIOL_001859 [Candidatus Rhodobacter lobularis]